MSVSSDLYNRAKHVFLEASALPTEKRREYVRSAADGDSELEAEVSSLLDQDLAPEVGTIDLGLMRRAMAEMVPVRDAMVGQRINGRYHLLRVVGAGAMSTVYEAEQIAPRRSVAVKVLSFTDQSGSLVARIEHEAQLLAELQHPSITQVYEFGFFRDGSFRRPFIAMEFVKGALTLTNFADARSLSTVHRLELFAQVCEAVHHAHQKPIIHRDIKPSNILVDPSGMPRLIDFGVARATNSDLNRATMHTTPGQLVGTLQYMSPEQCAADPRLIDVRSDVYSLGVVLFELLSSRLPYDLSDRPPVVAASIVQRGVRERLSNTRQDLRGDIETVVDRALEKNRDARYQTVIELLDDVRRVIERKPIKSRRRGKWTRMRTWIGDHPLMATSAVGLLILGLSVVLTLASVFALAIRPERVEVQSDHASVTLLSRAGHQLWKWDTTHPGLRPELAFAQLVSRHRLFGGGRVVLVAGPSQAPNDIAAFDPSYPGTPLWTTRGADVRFPPGEPGHPETVLVPVFAITGEFLPEVAGKQLLAIHQLAGFSAAVVRIYDFSGKVRYQAWHDGAINGAVWLPSARVAVFAAYSSESSWAGRGVVSTVPKRYPAVAFALRIKDGHIGNDWIVRNGKRIDDAVSWYKWLGPIEAIASLQEPFPVANPWIGGTTSDERATVTFLDRPVGSDEQSRNYEGGFLSITLNAAGMEVSRFVDEVFRIRIARGEYPQEASLKLLDYELIPPVLSARKLDGPEDSPTSARHPDMPSER